jgi:hypothetical protein
MASERLYVGAYAHEVEGSVEAPVMFPFPKPDDTIQFYDIANPKKGKEPEGRYQVFIDVPTDRSMVTFGIAFLPNDGERTFLGNKSSPRSEILRLDRIDFIMNYFSYGATRYDDQNNAHMTMDEANTENLKKYLNGGLS